MPILSVNFGISTVRGVYLSDEGNVSDYAINYSYQENLYSFFYSEKKFYSDIVDHFIKKLKVTKKELQLIATGFPKAPTIRYEYANTITTDQLFNQVENYDLVSLSNNTVFTQNSYLTLKDVDEVIYGSMESNYLQNLSVYKNVFPSRPSDYNLMFSNVWNMINSHRQNTEKVILSEKPTLFLGDIFSIADVDNEHFEKIAYLHILSLIINPGVFSILIDKKNIFPNIFHLKIYRNDLSYIYDNFKPELLGTLINSPGETTCLIETALGTSQLLDVGPGRIAFVPLDMSDQARVVVKSVNLGSIEKNVQGGKLGLIIDTRAKNDLDTYDHNQLQIDINANLKNIGQVLAKI